MNNENKSQLFLVKKSVSYIFTSDPNSGATVLDDAGNRFRVQLDNPLSIPASALNCTLKVTQANIWYVSPNISTNLNNNTIYYFNGLANQTIVIPDGLYGLDDLNSLISRELVNNGDTGDLFQLIAENSTQKVVILFNAIGVSIDFTQPDTPREILGFDAIVVGPSISVGETITANNTANFNQINSYIIHSDIVGNGIPINSFGVNAILSVPIDVQPGSQITYSPRNTQDIDANELISRSKNILEFWLTSEDGVTEIDTFGEYYSFVVTIEYDDVMNSSAKGF